MPICPDHRHFIQFARPPFLLSRSLDKNFPQLGRLADLCTISQSSCRGHNKGVSLKQFFVTFCLHPLTMSVSVTFQRWILALLDQICLCRQLEIHFQRLLGMISATVVVVSLDLYRALPLQAWLNAFRLHLKLDRHLRLWVAHTCLQALHPWKDK